MTNRLEKGLFIKYYIKYYDEYGDEDKSDSPNEYGLIHSITSSDIEIVSINTRQPIHHEFDRDDIVVVKTTERYREIYER